jgi:hypothetical protein
MSVTRRLRLQVEQASTGRDKRHRHKGPACTCPKLAAIFAAAERDLPPEALGVTNEPAPLLPSRGAARQLETA